MACAGFSNFGDYFEENMRALGLPAPSSIFTSAAVAYANIDQIASAVSLHGKTATLSKVWETGSRLERLKLTAPVLASFYAGAAAGSAAVAIGRALGCGATITDAIVQLQNHGIHHIWLESELKSNPNYVNPIG